MAIDARQRSDYPTRPAAAADVIDVRFGRRFSWPAVAAGVILATVVQLVLGLLGLGIGLTSVNPATGDGASPQALGVGAAIYWIISGLVSLFIGGWVAGRLAAAPRKFDSGMHGLITWATAGVLSLIVLSTTLGGGLGGALSIVQGSVYERNSTRMGADDAGIYGYAKGNGRASVSGEVSAADVERVAEVTSTAALWAFGAAVLGAGVATFGGIVGRPSNFDRDDDHRSDAHALGS